MSHLLALLRGWYPHFLAQLRTWGALDWALYGILFFLCLSAFVMTHNSKGVR